MQFFDELLDSSLDVSLQSNLCKKPAFKPHAKFSAEDDERLRVVVEEFGEGNWALIAEHMPGRNARQCKERWSNYLSPRLNRSPWTAEEDELLLKKQQEIGSKWVKISSFFENRTDAMCKNRFQVLKRKASKEKELQERREMYAATSGSESTPLTSPQEKVVEVEDKVGDVMSFLAFFEEGELAMAFDEFYLAF